MWYKQLSAFLLPSPPSAALLEAALMTEPYMPPASLDWFNEGFALPQPFSDGLVFDTDGRLGFALKREEKVLPTAIIREQVQKLTEKIEREEARPVGRKERQELKERVTDDLLPKALTRSSRTNGLIAGNWLLVDTASAAKAEKLLTRLRQALGGIDSRLPRTQESPRSLMTRWLLESEAQGGFELDDCAVLVGSGNAATRIKIDRSDLTREDIVQHVKNGLEVCEIGLIWQARISFVLTADLKLKRIRYLDTLTETYDNHADDAATLAFATQIIMSNSLTAILDELIEVLGGFAD
nr:recombination-associated protein RdgC [Neisseria meningitidis]